MEKIRIRDGKNLDPRSGMEKIWIRDPRWKKVGSGIRDKHSGSAKLNCTGTCVRDPRIAEEGEINRDRAGLPEVRQRRAKVRPILLLEGGVGKPATELAVARRTLVQVGRSTARQAVKERPVTSLNPGRKILTWPMLTLCCCCCCSRRL